jgi:ATP-binding cassette, subfamily B, bacterial
MSVDLMSLAWPANRVGEACLALAREARIETGRESVPAANLQTACSVLGIEAQRQDLTADRLADQLTELVPGIVQTPGGGFWALCGSGTRSLTLISPKYRKHRIDRVTLEKTILAPFAAGRDAEAAALAKTCGLGGAESKLREVLLRDQLRGTTLTPAWELQMPPGSSFAQQLRAAGVWGRLVRLFLVHFLEYTALILAWFAVGQGALTGRVDTGWLLGAAVLLALTIPARLFITRNQGWIALAGGGLLRQRLLVGAMAMDSDRMRREGAGQLMGRVLETESLEDLALGGGLLAALAALELLLAVVVLALGAAPVLGPLALFIWIALSVAIALRYLRLRRDWAAWRLHMTHGLVERMTGHRTRLAQEPPEKWHLREDREMEQYVRQSAEADRWAARLTALAPRGWLALGVLVLTPHFLSASPSSHGLAISLGGVLIALLAFRRAGLGVLQLADAWISWEKTSELFHSAGRNERSTVPPSRAQGEPVLEAANLAYTYANQHEPALSSCTLRISRGDALLLEGSSGSGKSTLVSVLAGMRDSTGLLLSSGLDRPSLGPRLWRKQVALAPQYHENHIMAASLAFNLLLGRDWPPADGDLQEAWEICQELGLGGLLERMPEGLHQTVGETGWQLSQGERSRVFLARALLQSSATEDGGLVILDESFGALDPETLGQCLQCALKRAPSLLVVAHP